MAKITLSKLNFMMFLFVVIVLLTATINIAQTKEEIDILVNGLRKILEVFG